MPKTTTEDGISIDFNLLLENADSSIRSNREPLSNVTDSSDLHQKKLSLPKTTTEDGKTMDCSPDPRNPESQIPSKFESLSNATTDTRHKNPENDFTDEPIQTRPSEAESETDEQTLRTSPTSTIF
jgi:hypothetical protein